MKIKVALDERGIKQLANNLKQYAEQLDKKRGEFCRRLGEIGVNAAKQAVRVDTGELQASVRFEITNDGRGLIIAEGNYVAFVEFGTGIVGEGTYEGKLPSSWDYNEQRTPAAHDMLDPWKWYYVDDNGQVHSTYGQTANGFMAKGADEMRNAVLKIAKEVFVFD